MEPIRTTAELYAHALAMEEEAAHRYVELALRMLKEQDGDELAQVFWRLGRAEGGHYAALLRESAGLELSAVPAARHQWPGAAPETPGGHLQLRLMTPRQALVLALDAERRARDFYLSAARESPDAAVRELARGMAAEEDEHIALLLRQMDRAPAAPAVASEWDRLFVETPFEQKEEHAMFCKHILIPVDGSEVAAKAAREGLRLAVEAGARVTWFTALEEYELPSQGAIMRRQAQSLQAHAEAARERAQALLGPLAQQAHAAGVQADIDYVLSNQPAEAIAEAARRHGCDLIVMATHGRSALGTLVHGSRTREVLACAGVPTLVYR